MNSDTTLDTLALSHAQAKWLMAHVLSLGDWTDSALDSYIKLLRREGVPFDAGETPGGPGTNVVYGYDHLMELALALMLRHQGILRKDVIGLLASMRRELRPLFRQAWIERETGLGARVPVTVDGKLVSKASGIWLDLGLSYQDNGVLIAMEPKLLGPEGAVKALITMNRQQHFRDPIRISDIAQAILRFAPDAPEVRRGRP